MLYNLFVANKNFNVLYTYRSDSLLQYGQIVKVVIGNIKKEFCGVVINQVEDVANCNVNSNANSNVNFKNILFVTDFVLQNDYIKFLMKFAEYNMVNIGAVLEMALQNAFSEDSGFNSGKLADNKILDSAKLINTDFLSAEQKHCALQIVNLNKPTLLHGATGSGKTLTVLEAIRNIIFPNKEDSGAEGTPDCKVLIIVPEVVLCLNWHLNILKFFGYDSYLYNYKISAKKKKNIFAWAQSSIGGFVIGTRSCLLLPYKNLKLIVIDEEHSTSLKQSNYPPYNARDMSILRAKYENLHCVLISATPSLETIYNAKIGKYDYVKLNRVQNSGLAEVLTIKLNKYEILAPKTIELMKDTFAENGQVLLFLNRKGYSPYCVCTRCYNALSCSECRVPLILYINGNVICNRCYKAELLPYKCEGCHENTLWKFYGLGVEKLMKEVKMIFHDKNIDVITSDTQDIEEKLAKIDKGETNCIIATQILAQGHDFKNIKVSVIVDADKGLRSLDFRATERMFQLWQQIRGRSGRHHTKGLMVIQTQLSENRFISMFNDENAYENMLEERRTLNWPPFSSCALLHVQSIHYEQTRKNLIDLSLHQDGIEKNLIDGRLDVSLYGPLYLGKYGKLYKWNFILKAPKNIIHLISEKILAKMPKHTKSYVEIDPYEFV